MTSLGVFLILGGYSVCHQLWLIRLTLVGGLGEGVVYPKFLQVLNEKVVPLTVGQALGEASGLRLGSLLPHRQLTFEPGMDEG